MAEIMAKFRIKYTSLKMVDDISVQPHADTQKFFNTLISGYREKEGVYNTGKYILLKNHFHYVLSVHIYILLQSTQSLMQSCKLYGIRLIGNCDSVNYYWRILVTRRLSSCE